MGETAKLHSDLEALVGSTIHDRYEVETLLGSGGMGAVFKARHTGLQRGVAIKVLHPEIGRDASVSKRFDREAHSASRLDHPNCVRVTDFGTTDNGTKYLVMELLEGGDLDGRLGQPWAPERAIATIEQVLYGLEHAHHVGIVHRDLKPENIFVTSDFKGEEVVKIVDFGIAKLIDEQGSEKLTRQGVVFGTPRYMSPEQAAGGKIDERTDLYAVGLILYELLAGHPPFQTDDAAQLLRMQIMAPPPPLPASVPAGLVEIVEKLLEKSKADRHASAREVLDALARVKQGLVAPGLVAAAPVVPVAPVSTPASSGAAWQPAPVTEPVPAISGATLAAPAADFAAVSMSAAATSVVQTGPSHPSMSVASVTASHPAAPSSSRRWLPIALAAVTLVFVLAGVGAVLSSIDDDEQASSASEPEAPPATVANSQAAERGEIEDDRSPQAQPAEESESAIAPGPVREPETPSPIRARPIVEPKSDSKSNSPSVPDAKPTDSKPKNGGSSEPSGPGDSSKSGGSKTNGSTDSTTDPTGNGSVDPKEAEQRREPSADEERRKHGPKGRDDDERDEPRDKDKGKGKGKGNDKKKPQ